LAIVLAEKQVNVINPTTNTSLRHGLVMLPIWKDPWSMGVGLWFGSEPGELYKND